MGMVLANQALAMPYYPNKIMNSHDVVDLYGKPKIISAPKVSVCIITYRHANFIEKCLESIVNQMVNFDYEIILGEDYSQDETVQIVKRYADAYPNLIKAYVRQQNLGAKQNFLNCFLQCRGEYVIYIEGDDYWTDYRKLQKQADFLDTHLTASACFHNAEIIFEDGSERPTQLVNYPNQALWINTGDFFKEKETWFMATASVMMRRKYVNPLPSWFKDCKSGDIPMYVILAERGPIGYIPEIMSVYRKHLGGQSYTDSIKSKEFLLNRIFMYTVLNEYTNKKYNEFTNPILADYHEMLIHCDDYRWSLKQKHRHLMLAYRLQPNQNFKTFFNLFKKNLALQIVTYMRIFLNQLR
jgi:glycosyltransferase involved in cell wall biosynthesis